MGGVGRFSQAKPSAVLDFTGMADCFSRTLTTGVDNIVGNAGNDSFNAILGTGATFNIFDTINGGDGTDTLNLVTDLATALTLPVSTSISGIETVNLSRSGVGATTTAITNTTFGTGVTSLNVVDAGNNGAGAQSATLNSATSVSYVSTATAFGTIAVTDASTVAASTGSTLKTVTITNSGAANTLTGNGITTLNLSAATTTVTTVTAAAGTRTLTINAAGASDAGVTDATATSVVINSTVTAAGGVGTYTHAAATTVNFNTTTANTATINAGVATTLNVGGSALSTLTLTGSTALTTVNVSGTGSLAVDLTSVATAVTALNFNNTAGTSTVTVNTGTAVTGGAGVEVITFGATTKSNNLGAGNDTASVTVTALGTGGAINGGDGTDTLKLSNADAVTLNTTGTAAFKAAVTGFETLDITNQLATTVDVAAVGTFSTIKMITASNAQVLSNVTSGQTLEMVYGAAGTSLTTNNLSGASDNLTVKLGGDLSAAAQAFGIVATPGAETVNIVMNDTNTTFTTRQATATLNDTAASSIVVTGNNGLTLIHQLDNNATASTNLTNLDASGLLKGAISYTSGILTTDATVKGSLLGGDTLNFAAATSKVTITETAGTNTLTGSATFANTITGGSGADTIVTGAAADIINAGAGNDVITGGLGADTINVGAGTDTVNVASNATGTATATAGSLTALGVIGASTLSFATTAMDHVTGMSTAGDNVQLTVGALTSATLLTGASTWGAATVGDVALVRGNDLGGVFTASATGIDSALIWDSNGVSAAGTYSAIILVGYVDAGTADTISTAGLFTIVA